MKFKIEQLALYPKDPGKAMELLSDMGAGDWAKDHVVAVGEVFCSKGENEANLAFDYDLPKTYELEVLEYTKGDNWMENRSLVDPFRVSHIGMHCSKADLDRWEKFFEKRGIGIAQEVNTKSHENPLIKGKRTYNYVIFDTFEILGVDVKFIVRKNLAPLD